MDGGWAVVLGAVIALTGSALIPWVREAISARRAEKARVDRALERSIREVVHVLATISHSRPLSMPEIGKLDVEARDAVTAFDLLLDGRSQPVSVALDLAFSDAASKDERLRQVARSTIPLLLTGWKAGMYSGPDVYKRYVTARDTASGS